MSQNDMSIANQGFAAFRADLNTALQALASTSKGASAPSTAYAGQLWLEDDNPSSTVWTLWQYDGTDWIKLGEVDSTNNKFNVMTNQSADAASAATVNLDTAYGLVTDVTGTTTITAVTLGQGRVRIVRFTGALTLTHGSSLVLPGAANITTAAGDYAILVGYASGVVRCVGFFPARRQTAGVLPFRLTAGATIAAASTVYLASCGSDTNEGNADLRVPFACTARNLYVNAGGSPGAGKNFTYTLRKNNADTALTVAVNGGNTAAADTSNAVALAAGDRVNIKVVSDSGANAVGGVAATVELF